MIDLYHAPPRLSDLKGDDLRTALFERHERAKAEWHRARARLPLSERIIAAVVAMRRKRGGA